MQTWTQSSEDHASLKEETKSKELMKKLILESDLAAYNVLQHDGI